MPILDNLCQGFLSGVPSDWVASTPGKEGEVTSDMVDDLAKQHFPLCMRNLHQNLKKDHHLKHFERLTYGLFLKVISDHLVNGTLRPHFTLDIGFVD